MNHASATTANDSPAWLKTLAAVANYAALAAFVGQVVWQIVTLSIESDTKSAPITWQRILAFLGALLVALCLYVAGQVVAMLLTGFRPLAMSAFGMHVHFAGGPYQPSFPSSFFGTSALVMTTRSGRFRGRLLAYLAAGRLTFLLGAVLALSVALRWQPECRAAPAWLDGAWYRAWLWPGNNWVLACNLLWGFCLTQAVFALVPVCDDGLRNDASLALDCLRSRPGAFRGLAAAALWEAISRQRPRDWDPVWVNLLAGNADGSPEQAWADWMGYYHAIDANRPDEAGRRLYRALAARAGFHPPYQQLLLVEAAYYEGFHQEDAEEARHWLKQIDRSVIDAQSSMRAEAAVLGAEGRHAEALALLDSAIHSAERAADSGVILKERDWLRRMRERIQDRQSSSRDGIRASRDRSDPGSIPASGD